MVASRVTKIFERIVEPNWKSLDVQGARAILQMKFAPRDIDRMNELAALARRGQLTPGEREELDLFCNLGDLLTIMHSRAKRVLGVQTPRRSSPRRRSAGT
jgi:hypothetical protein